MEGQLLNYSVSSRGLRHNLTKYEDGIGHELCYLKEEGCAEGPEKF